MQVSISWLGIALGCVLGPMASHAQTERREALVLGDQSYGGSQQLKNPCRDAQAVGAMLKGVGFQVVSACDLKLLPMGRAIRDFSERLDENTVAILYYSGHGVEVNGQNYLLPDRARGAKPGGYRHCGLSGATGRGVDGSAACEGERGAAGCLSR